MRYIQTKQQTVIIYVLHSLISVNYSWYRAVVKFKEDSDG